VKDLSNREYYEEILKGVYKVTEVNDNNVWEELQKRDLVVVKLITIEKYSGKKLNYIPYAGMLCYVGYVNVELIKYKDWNFFAVLPPVNDMLRKRFGVGKFAVYVEERDPTDHMNVSNKAFITVDEKAVYKFVRARANVVP
jgi:hypothetical protein